MNKLKFIKNKKGVAIITAYMIIGILTGIGVGFMARSLQEFRDAQRYTERAQAFWIAEAGASEAINNLKANPNWTPPSTPTSFGGGTYSITITDYLPVRKDVTITGTRGESQRIVQFSLPYIVHEYTNAISVGGKLREGSVFAKFKIYNGDVEVGDRVQKYKWRWWPPGWYWKNDKSWVQMNNGTLSENVNPDPQVRYPDMDGDGISNEFEDFTAYNQNLISTYDPNEVVYIKTDSTVQIWPGWNGEGAIFVGGSRLKDENGNPITLAGKKIVYVEGSEGNGDVGILFGASEVWNDGEDLTIITTGSIVMGEPLQFTSNSRLNLICWENYSEVNILLSNHISTIFSVNGNINLFGAANLTSTTGVFISNNYFYFWAVLAARNIYFNDDIKNGSIPPGFEGLIGSSASLSTSPYDWKEIL